MKDKLKLITEEIGASHRLQYHANQNLIRQLIVGLSPNLKSKFADHLADILNIDNDYYTTRSFDRVYSLNSYIVWELISAPIEKLVDALWRTLELDKKTT